MAGTTKIFVPSIYGQHWYGTIFYGGQWITLKTPPQPPPTAPPYPPPVLYPTLPPPPAPQQIPPGYQITNFTSFAVNYETIALTWQPPVNQQNILDFRLLSSRYGFPVDQNDGNILIDTDATGGVPSANSFFDSSIIPGTMHYYGVYLLLNLSGGPVWYRSGFTATLALKDFDSADWLSGRLPEYWRQDAEQNELTTSDNQDNLYLDQFMAVFGWGEDYLRTQLALTGQTYNPQLVPVNWLADLAATLGFPYYSEITAGTTRNALSNAAAIVQSRGTALGIEGTIEQLTGWGADVRVGYNQMLEDDQADFLDPVFSTWNSLISYDQGENVTYQGFLYTSMVNLNQGNQPTGQQTSNTFWQLLYYTADSTTLANPTTGWLNTWEPWTLTSTNANKQYTVNDGAIGQTYTYSTGYSRVSNNANAIPRRRPQISRRHRVRYNLWNGPVLFGLAQSTALTEYVGILDPVLLQYTGNGLAITNISPVTANLELRSISRTPGDSAYPNTGQVIGDGIPIPYINQTNIWSSTAEYLPNQIVSYNGSPFLALIANVGITPPTNGIATDTWAPIGYDPRIALMLSGYTSDSFATGLVQQFNVVPLVYWFDETGTFINSLYLRTNLGGGAPNTITFDSFALSSAWGSNLGAGTPPDIQGSDVGNWSQTASTFQINAYLNGCVVPNTTNKTIASMNFGTATAEVGVTLSAFEGGGGRYAGLVCRLNSSTSYIRVDQTGIYTNNGGTYTLLQLHSTPANPGDRLTVTCSANVITAFINGTQVSTATTAFNNTQTKFGIVVEPNTNAPASFGKPMPLALERQITTGRTGRFRRGRWGRL